MVVLTIARLTLREASRRRLLIAVAILTVVLALFTGWGFHKLLQLPCGEVGHPHPCSLATQRLLAATLIILLMFMFSFVLALGAAFVGAPAIWNDIESGIALAVLPRPIRRSEVVLGKWLGLSALLALYAGGAGALEFGIADISMGYVPPHPVLAVVFVTAEAIALLTLTLAGSTRLPAMTCGIVALVLFGLTWMAGVAGAVGATFHSQPVENVGTVSSLILPTDGLWRASVYNLEPAAFLVAQDVGNEARANSPFTTSSPPTTPYVIWSAVWIAAMLGLTAWSLSRREL
jgi:ABC-type transport system involved in multi-copper enzyme maturation permease subunit